MTAAAETEEDNNGSPGALALAEAPGIFMFPEILGGMKFPLKCGRKYSILDKLSYRPSVCDKAALVGESAVPCYLQSATAGMNSHPRSGLYRLPHISGDEESVSRNGIPRTMSGGEPSSIKRIFSCAVSLPLPSWLYGYRV